MMIIWTLATRGTIGTMDRPFKRYHRAIQMSTIAVLIFVTVCGLMMRWVVSVMDELVDRAAARMQQSLLDSGKELRWLREAAEEHGGRLEEVKRVLEGILREVRARRDDIPDEMGGTVQPVPEYPAVEEVDLDGLIQRCHVAWVHAQRIARRYVSLDRNTRSTYALLGNSILNKLFSGRDTSSTLRSNAYMVSLVVPGFRSISGNGGCRLSDNTLGDGVESAIYHLFSDRVTRDEARDFLALYFAASQDQRLHTALSAMRTDVEDVYIPLANASRALVEFSTSPELNDFVESVIARANSINQVFASRVQSMSVFGG